MKGSDECQKALGAAIMTETHQLASRFYGAQTDMQARVRCNLFLLCPNNSGSTYLAKAIATSPDVWSLPREGQHALGFRGPITQRENALIWAAEHESLSEITRPTGFNWPQNRKTWYFQAQARTKQASVFFTKAPPFLAYADQLEQNFPNCRFLIMVRNPYAVIEAILRNKRRNNASTTQMLETAIAHVLACLRMQQSNKVRFAAISRFFTYEALCAQPVHVAAQIKALVPEIRTLDLDQTLPVKGAYNEPLRDMNADQIARLSGDQIAAITNAFAPHEELLAAFGYPLISA